MLQYSVHLFPQEKSAKMALQFLKFVDGTEKSVNTDQAKSGDQGLHSGAVWSGSTLFHEQPELGPHSGAV